MPTRVPTVVPMALLALGAAILFPSGAGAYINTYGSRAAYEREQGHLGPPSSTTSYTHALRRSGTKAWECQARGEWQEAIRLWGEAIDQIKSEPVFRCGVATVYCYRGDARWQARDYAGALADYRAAVREVERLAKENLRDPQADRRAYIRLAVAYAACPDPALRDQKKSITAAKAACALVHGYHNYAPIECESILAALHAAAGDFEAAIAVQSGVVLEAGTSGWQEVTKLHLRQYEQHKMVWKFDPWLTGPADPRPRKPAR